MLGNRMEDVKIIMTVFLLYSMAFEMLPISSNMYSICGDISVLKFRLLISLRWNRLDRQHLPVQYL
jgi:hypothetical protein